jgi:hypothetical protein
MLSHALQDAALTQTKALPNGAASTSTTGIDLESVLSPAGAKLAPCEVLLGAPALGTTPMPDAKTMKYKIEHDDDSGFGSVATLQADLVIQTGAGGAGCAAAVGRMRLPSNTKRYIRATATGSTTGDASASSMTLQLVF